MNAVVTVLAALGALSWVGTIINAFAQRRKVKAEAGKTGADAAKVLTDTALESATAVMAELRRDIADARTEADALRRDLAGTRAELDALRGHLRHVEGMMRERGVDFPTFVWPRRT